MPEPLAIVGASVRAAAASAVRAGFQPVTADLFADLDLRRIATATRISPYPAGFLDWLRALEPPAWMYTGALENHPELVDQMAWIAPLWGNPGDVLHEVRSPWILADALRESGFLFPETRPVPDGLPHDGSWLVKTYRGASGSGVSALVAGAPETSISRCYQQRVAGTPCAGVFVANGESATLLGLTRQLVGEDWLRAREFQYAGSMGPYWVAEAAFCEMWRIGHELASRFSLMGLFGVDFIINEENVWTLEVNPRYTASVEIIERATGTTSIATHATACRGTEPWPWNRISMWKESYKTQFATTQPVHGKAILFAKRPVVVAECFAEWALGESLMDPWPRIADVSPANTPIAAGRPVITVFATGASVFDVEQQLRERVAEVEAKLYAD
ncbi:MAG: ATP-grasp domain-containing protein [Pirellulales bacterium]